MTATNKGRWGKTLTLPKKPQPQYNLPEIHDGKDRLSDESMAQLDAELSALLREEEE